MKDKVVLITGASSGIGRALALKFAKEGSRVMLGARSIAQLAEVGEEIRKAGGTANWASLDVRRNSQIVKDLYRKPSRSTGRLTSSSTMLEFPCAPCFKTWMSR